MKPLILAAAIALCVCPLSTMAQSGALPASAIPPANVRFPANSTADPYVRRVQSQQAPVQPQRPLPRPPALSGSSTATLVSTPATVFPDIPQAPVRPVMPADREGLVQMQGNIFMQMDDSGNKITFHPSGDVVLVRPDGTKIDFMNNSHTMVYSANGERYQYNPDNTQLAVMADGTQMAFYPNKTKVAVLPDGRKNTVYEDGSSAWEQNGTTITTHTDGRIASKDTQGRQRIQYQDGVILETFNSQHTLRFPDGRVAVRDNNGVSALYDSQGQVIDQAIQWSNYIPSLR